MLDAVTYEISASGTTQVVHLSGEIDLSDSDGLDSLVREAHGADSVDIDVAGVRYADTAFLRFLLRLVRREQGENRRVRLLGASDRMRRLLDVTGISPIVRCV